jgi:hypothetical protein
LFRCSAMEMMFFTAAEPSVSTVFYLRPVYPQCAGKAARPTCPSQRFCERDNTPAGLFGPLPVISGYDNRRRGA